VGNGRGGFGLDEAVWYGRKCAEETDGKGGDWWGKIRQEVCNGLNRSDRDGNGGVRNGEIGKGLAGS